MEADNTAHVLQCGPDYSALAVSGGISGQLL